MLNPPADKFESRVVVVQMSANRPKDVVHELQLGCSQVSDSVGNRGRNQCVGPLDEAGRSISVDVLQTSSSLQESPGHPTDLFQKTAACISYEKCILGKFPMIDDRCCRSGLPVGTTRRKLRHNKEDGNVCSPFSGQSPVMNPSAKFIVRLYGLYDRCTTVT